MRQTPPSITRQEQQYCKHRSSLASVKNKSDLWQHGDAAVPLWENDHPPVKKTKPGKQITFRKRWAATHMCSSSPSSRITAYLLLMGRCAEGCGWSRFIPLRQRRDCGANLHLILSEQLTPTSPLLHAFEREPAMDSKRFCLPDSLCWILMLTLDSPLCTKALSAFLMEVLWTFNDDQRT